MAQQAQTDEESLLDMFFSAALRDWPAEQRRWQAVAERLAGGREVRLTGRETDLRFSVAGRTWAVDGARENMPGGEIWTAPVTSTLDGTIYFEFPGVLGGRLVRDIRLDWRTGALVRATASAHEDFLQQVVHMDSGASLVGEFAVGTNYGLDRFCNDILLDEKIGGTVHIALGRAYPEVGGDNQSALHWDIIKDTRTEGAIYLDGDKVFEAGRFLIT
jgi:aminopeptidase